MYFQNFFETNKNDVKKTWKGIKNILAVSKKKVTSIDYLSYKGKMCKNDNDKANALNDFFTNIGKMVENKIPKSKISYKDFLLDPNIKTIIHKPCSESEFSDIIKSLKASKAIGPYSIATSLLHSASHILTPILTTLKGI